MYTRTYGQRQLAKNWYASESEETHNIYVVAVMKDDAVGPKFYCEQILVFLIFVARVNAEIF